MLAKLLQKVYYVCSFWDDIQRNQSLKAILFVLWHSQTQLTVKSAGLFSLLKSTYFSWAVCSKSPKILHETDFRLHLCKCQEEIWSRGQQPFQTENVMNGLIKIYTETSVLAHLQEDSNRSKTFILNTHLEREGSIAMTVSFFPLQTDWKKCRVLYRSLPACFHYHISTAQRAEWQNSHAQLRRCLSAGKGSSGAAESTFTQSHWPQRTGLLLLLFTCSSRWNSRTVPIFMA